MESGEPAPIAPLHENGNSERSPEKKESARLWYLVTINNYTETDIHLLQDDTYFNKWLFQEEICPTTGTPHLQGFLRCITKKHFSTICNDWKGWHFTFMNGTIAQNVKYCTKSVSRKPEGRRWTKGFKLPKEIKTITKLYTWQQEVVDKVLREPDDRAINWYFEETGNVGKTALAKYLAVRHNALVVSGGSAHVKYAVCKWLESHGNTIDILIINVPRASSGHISYKSLEEVKDGLFFNTKYESKMCIFNPPHILVFANEMPDIDMMSKDRWNINKIVDPTDSKDSVLHPSSILDYV